MQVSNQEYIHQCLEFIKSLQNEGTRKQAVILFEGLLITADRPLPMLLYLKNIYQLESFPYFIVMYAFLYELDTDIISYINKSSKLPYLSFEVLLSLYSNLYEISPLTFSEGVQFLHDKTLFSEIGQDYALSWKVKLRKNVIHTLNTGCFYEDKILRVEKFSNEISPVFEKQKNDFLIAMQMSYICVICGAKGTGKKTLLMRCAEELSMPVYSLSLPLLLHQSKEKQEEVIEEVIFYCRLQAGILYIENVINQYEEELRYILDAIQKEPLHIILSSTYPLSAFPANLVLPRTLPYEDMCILSNELWHKNWPYPCIHLKLEDFMRLKDKDEEGEHLMEYIYAARTVVTDSNYYHLIKSPYKLQDWQGDEGLKKQLQQIIYLFKKRDEFITSQIMSAACTVLFHGPSGTGKTFAAGIIGNETNLPVWQIDLSTVMDKYIGESEKHLHEIFENAQNTNAILLFDEADVLFGKRTGINTSNDRYANSSTAFLLQELERYHGCVIMTSNVLSNFDDAFLRRISFIIRFPLPDFKAKVEKWKACFHAIPCACELPYEVFAKQLSLTQAQIQNIVQNAVLCWKIDGTQQMTLQHVVQAIQQEYQKKQEHMPVLNI